MQRLGNRQPVRQAASAEWREHLQRFDADAPELDSDAKRLVQQAIVWLGMPDPVSDNAELNADGQGYELVMQALGNDRRANDSELAEIRQLLKTIEQERD